MKIIVAIPVYDSKLFCKTINCLMGEQYVANKLGDELHVEFLPNCSHPAMGRNQLADAFMKSDYDKIIYLDSDITFEIGALIKLAHLPKDYVGGCYRFKLEKESYPISYLPGHREADEFGLIEVGVIPGGFTCLSRKVFEDLKKAHPEREFTHMGQTLHCYYQTPFANGLHSEESFFASDWRSTGGKVFLCPELTITHWDFNPVPYTGNIGRWLKSQITDEMNINYLNSKKEKQLPVGYNQMSGLDFEIKKDNENGA